jgi:ribosomal protein S4E
VSAAETTPAVQNGDACAVVKGVHAGKSGTVQDLKTSKTGHLTITVQQDNGERLKTLARNVVVKPKSA